MTRNNNFCLPVAVLLLAACSPGGDQAVDAGAVPGSGPDAPAESWREAHMLTGEEVYEAVCSECHREGKDGAPATGDRDAWSGRSELWVAVLADHARSGYLNMPQKGGHRELSDEEVSAAVEYMLQQTFPELPED